MFVLSHAYWILISLDALFLARFAIAKVWVFPTRLTTCSTLILLLPVGRFAVLNKLFATAVIAHNISPDHALACQSRLSHYPVLKCQVADQHAHQTYSFVVTGG